MKLSNGFWQTFKEVPNDAEIISHQLMIRAGLIQKTTAGLYNYLPVGLRILQKIEKIVREELNRIDCYELAMSIMTPAELWQESGRWSEFGPLMLRVQDRLKREMCMSPTNEEAVTDVFRKSVKSYRQLPVTLYQIRTKFRDEIRPRFGVMRAREFDMMDAYSFHNDWDCLRSFYDQMYKAYEQILIRMGLDFMAVEASAGAMASSDARTHEFQVIADAGEDELILCSHCGYRANREKSQTGRPNIQYVTASATAPQEVSTPTQQTIEDVCGLLQIPQHQSLKSLVYYSVDSAGKAHPLLLILLGDDKLCEAKLKAFLGHEVLTPANDADLQTLGLAKGFIGPYQLNPQQPLRILVDSCIDINAAYVVGANKEGFHLTNFVPKRDFHLGHEQISLREDQNGDLCSQCQHPIIVKRGIEVGHIFQLGDKYTKAMSVAVLSKEGKPFAPVMGCYGIGTTRLIAATIEQHHDDKGIIWPVAIAPYHIYLGVIGKEDETFVAANRIYSELRANNFEVMLDDRRVSPGFMMNDADLLGLPVRVILGERDYKSSREVEVKIRRTGEVFKVSVDLLISKLKEIFSTLR